VFFEGVWRRIGTQRGETREVQARGTPRFDALEPRLLLNADLVNPVSLLSLPTAPGEPALVVDLAREDQPVQEALAPLASLEIGRPSALMNLGDGLVPANSEGEDPFNLRIGGTVNAAANLALGKTGVASTSYPGLSASHATDGNTASRWSSQFSDSQWIYVDLGAIYTINRIVLRWETAYGRGYKLQVSNDASTWSEVYSTATGEGGVDEITLGAPGSGRYVRLLGTQRATAYGYSLWEFEVYGGEAPEVSVLGNEVSIADGDASPSVIDGTDFGSVVQDGAAISRTFTVRNEGTVALMLGAVTVPAGFTLTEALSSSLAAGAADTFTVQLETAAVGTRAGEISFSTDDSDENPFHFTITGTIQNEDASGNLALGRPATASTSYSGLPASNATDGNPASRWSSQFSDNEWIYVDLGTTYTINRVVLRWEPAYGRGYKVQVSAHASTWSDVYSTTTGDGGVDDLSLSSSGRYVRVLGTQRATMYGYSLYELEVYGEGATNQAPAVSSFSRSLVVDTPLPFAATDFAGAFTDLDAGDSLQKIKITSLPSQGVLRLNGTAVTLNQETATAQIGGLTYIPNSGYAGSDSFQWNGSDGSLYAATEAGVNLSIDAAVANLAVHKPAASSTSYSGLPAANATDGNGNSRWSSQFSDSEWICVDLGSVLTINRMALRWEMAYGRGYRLQVSTDASSWSDVYSTTMGDGGVDDLTLNSPASGRYVRMLGTQRATAYGYSLYELEVYGGAAGPEITVLGNGISIVDGDTTPSTADGTDFGSVTHGRTPISRVFTVRNDGDSTLKLGAATVPAGFTLMEGLSSGLAPGVSDTFTVQVNTNVLGTKTGDISFTSNDGDESPFNFRITGAVMPAAPEITVLGNEVSIADGDTTPSAIDGTDFGSIVQGGRAIGRHFTVRNGGTASLTLGPVTVPTGFMLTEALPGSLPAGASDTFTVQLDTAVAGIKTGELSFWTNDSDENPFNFAITGTIQNDDGSTNVALGRPATASTSYSGLPASNVTDGNVNSRWSSQFSDSQWLYVDLGSVFAIHQVVLRWETAYGRGYRLQVSGDAGSWSDVYGTTTGDGGVDDITLSSPVSGRYVRLLGTQRGTVYGYSLWEFEVYA